METLNHENLIQWYTQERKTDRQIAELCGVTRTAVVHARKKFNILSNMVQGRQGVSSVCQELLTRGHLVVDKRSENGLHSFDILLDQSLRIEVMTSSAPTAYGHYKFSLTTNPRKALIENDIRTRLSNGRMLKLYTKTCDFIICACFSAEDVRYWIIPSPLISGIQTLSLGPSHTSKYHMYLNAWHLLKLPLMTPVNEKDAM